MQSGDVLKILAKKAKLKIKGKPDAKFLRFMKNERHFSFLICPEKTKIVAHKYTLGSDGKIQFSSRPGQEYWSRFNLCDPNSVDQILAFMND